MILCSSQNKAIKGIQRTVSCVGLGEEITKGISEETHFELMYEGSIQMNQAKLKGKGFLRTSENQKVLCIVQLPEGRKRSEEER